MTAPIVHLCGWPGCGKRTIALALQGMIGGRVLDNHLILNPASALFDRGTPERARLRDAVRQVVYAAAEALPQDVPLILTDALAETDRHTELVEPTLALAAKRGVPLVPFVLQIDAAENARRLQAPGRGDRGKLTDADVLRDLRTRHDLLHLPGAQTLDVTDLLASEAAARIAAYVAGPI